MGGIKDIFDSKVASEVLYFLSEDPETEYLSTQIMRETGYSRMGVYLALTFLKEQGYVKVTKKSKLSLFSVNYKEPAVRQFKILRNIMSLALFTKKIKEVSDKIILYGSAARGEDTRTSDIDIAVIADEHDHGEIRKATESAKTDRKISAEIITPYGFNELKKKDAAYYGEISAGITLWEREQ